MNGTDREQELRDAATAGDREAMADLAGLLAAAGREAEAAYWRGRADEDRWAETAVPIGARRYPPLVLLAAVLVGVLGVAAVVVVGIMLVHASRTDDEMLVPVLLMLSLVPGAVAVVLLRSVAGLLRGDAAAARRAQGVVASLGSLAVAGSLWLLGIALSAGEPAEFLGQLLLLAAAVVVPLFGLAALLGRCVPRLGVTRRAR